MSSPRADKLVHNLEKLGAANVNVMRTDARRLDEFFSFDQILLDAPCTGTGTLRAGDERAEKRMTRQLLAKVVKSQRALLDRALTILKPDGTLVYSTCSILAEENDEQVRGALKRHRDCEVVPILFEKPSSDAQDGPRPIVLDQATHGPCALPVLPHSNALPGTLTIAPSRLFEGFTSPSYEKASQVTARRSRPCRSGALRAQFVHELVVATAFTTVFEHGENQVDERHDGDGADDHENGHQDIENSHVGHRSFPFCRRSR